MRNLFFPDEEISKNDLYFICYMIERVARRLKQPNRYVTNSMGKQALAEKLSLANVLHSENPLDVEQQFIEDFCLLPGTYDVTKVDSSLVDKIPTPLQMGKVYSRLILDTLQREEDYADGIIRIYNNEICPIIDNYNGSAYYEPSYVIARAYYEGRF